MQRYDGTGRGGLRDELRSMVGTGGNLPADADAAIDATIDSLDRHIDARIEAHLEQLERDGRLGQRHGPRHDGGAAGVVAVGIPFVVLAGVFGHSAGALVAVICVGALAFAQIIRGSRD